MRIFLTLALAFLVADISADGQRRDVQRPQLQMNQDGQIISLIIDGEPVEFERCDRREQVCATLGDFGRLIDQTSITVSVTQSDYSVTQSGLIECCYTYNHGGYLYDYCFDYPGSTCPILN